MTYNIARGIIVGLMFISLATLFCVLFVKLYIKKIKNYTRVIYEKDIEFQKSLTAAIIETQEQVLTNISQDLHDDAGQQLTYINFQLENLKFDSPQMETTLQPVSDSVRNLANTIRRISHSLNNQMLLQDDFLKAFAAEVSRMKNDTVTISLDAPQNFPRELGTNEKIVIYRIFQELVNNSLKHAQASHINITLKCDPFFTLIVKDNGNGFDPSAVKSNQTLGISSMISRATAINYRFDVASEKGKGTTITLTENES